jgi:NAD(P)-dependent dehydrogenase (short-subunit alcohol dehydrogenase family)
MTARACAKPAQAKKRCVQSSVEESDMNRIDNKIAVITGGTQGLGAAIARQFAMAGAAGLAIVGRGLAKGEAVAAAISEEFGIPVRMIAADLGNIEDVQRVMAEADGHFGRVDILVNAAGLTDRGSILNASPDLFDRMFAVNTRAPFFLMQEAAKIMIREGVEGRIVNIGSMSELAGQPFLCPYSASKGALATLTRNAGYALMRNRIHVNQLSIGWMNSDHERKLIEAETGDPDFIDRVASQKPFGRILDPKEVAHAVLWMASDDSGMMTGTIVNFDQSIWGAYDDAPVPTEAAQP